MALGSHAAQRDLSLQKLYTVYELEPERIKVTDAIVAPRVIIGS